jgi:hypothetical protein
MKSRIIALILGVIAIAPALLLFYHYQSQNTREGEIFSFNLEERPLRVGVEREVRACKVLDGNRFEMFLEGGIWIRATLAVIGKEEAGRYVSDLLHKVSPPSPSVIFLRRNGEEWVVDFYLTIDNRRCNLADLLKKEGLLYLPTSNGK